MKVLITGSRGTLGKVVTEQLKSEGNQVIPWNRSEVYPFDSEMGYGFVKEKRPDMIFHLATDSSPLGEEDEGWKINVEWSVHLARWAEELGIPFLFTSSVMVFTNDAKGPFYPDSIPDANEGYGYYKKAAEEHILGVNHDAVVARIGWQIGQDDGSNNMVSHLSSQMREKGEIQASTKWFPACSFLTDTAVEMIRLIKQGNGLFQLDSNSKWNFYEIVMALNKKLKKNWYVKPTEDFVYDQRMIDDRVKIPALNNRLKLD